MTRQSKSYSHDTAYGRKKIREQAEQYRQNLSPEERKNFDSSASGIYLIIILIIMGILYLIGGTDAIIKYLLK